MSAKKNRHWLRRLGVGAALANLLWYQAVAGCGRARSEDTGSETHWLTTCAADLDCGSGSCECGVCSRGCQTETDCAALSVPGVQCLELAVCGGVSEAAASPGVCLLPCAADIDCSALSEDASCRSGRCALRGTASIGLAPEAPAALEPEDLRAPAPDATPVPSLCDGSDDVRAAHQSNVGFATEDGFWSGPGPSFFAIDGQCRFWQAPNGNGQVYTGTIESDVAAAFAARISFGQQSGWRSVVPDECPGESVRSSFTLWTDEGTTECNCDCARTAPDDWVMGVVNERVNAPTGDVFDDGEAWAGPARLKLVRSRVRALQFDANVEPRAWPLARPPAATEITEEGGSVASAGALITEASELAALRALRANAASVPVLWTDPDSQVTEEFQLRLEDELPAFVREALERVGLP
jgi:hypothetical protein